MGQPISSVKYSKNSTVAVAGSDQGQSKSNAKIENGIKSWTSSATPNSTTGQQVPAKQVKMTKVKKKKKKKGEVARKELSQMSSSWRLRIKSLLRPSSALKQQKGAKGGAPQPYSPAPKSRPQLMGKLQTESSSGSSGPGGSSKEVSSTALHHPAGMATSIYTSVNRSE